MKRNPLEKYFYGNRKNLIHKWVHYFEIYHKYFDSFRDKKIIVVEFGVSHGGSLQMWKKYFGKKAKIYGIDIDSRCKGLEEKQIEIMIGDQSDRKFLRKIRKKIGPIDILIEDGGHHMDQQIATFEELFPAIKKNGIFLIEDLHTSYWTEYGGGYQKEGTFIEYTKNLIDQVNAWHSRDEKFVINDYTKTIKAIHIYDSVIVFEKGNLTSPRHERQGKPVLEEIKMNNRVLRDNNIKEC